MFNPQNTKPQMPLDVDEVDVVLERFIRQKYDRQLFSSSNARPAARNNTGSTRSSEDQPPPLPPKPGKRFGFGLRSASSTLPFSRNSPASPPQSPRSPNLSDEFGAPPFRVNKQSRVFGASVGGGEDNVDAKLAQLRDIGFTDDRRNASILKGLGGNLERTIESLARLGEGSAPISRSKTPVEKKNVAVSQPLPLIAQNARVVNDLSFAANSNGFVSQTNTGSTGPQSSQSAASAIAPQNQARSFSHSNPYQGQPQPYSNPFGISYQQSVDAPLQRAFGTIQISQQPTTLQQPLFPNATGWYPSQPPQFQDPRLQTMTPPVPQVPQQYSQANPFAQITQMPNGNYSPFYQTSQQSPSAATATYSSNTQPQSTQPYNPYQQSSIPQPISNGYSVESPQTYFPHTVQGSFPQQTFQEQTYHQQNFPQHQFPQQKPQNLNSYAPQHSLTDPLQYATQNNQAHNHYQPQPLQSQQTGRVDKSSILALYNYPQLAPPPLTNDGSNVPSAETSQGGAAKQGQRSATMPVQLSSGSRNPFQSAVAANTNGVGPSGHMSQESVDVGGLQNGRHSPDAFASLSARFVR